MRNVIFVGNCQSQALADIYNRFVCPQTSDKIHWIHIHAKRTSAEEQKLREADIVIQQLIYTTSGFNFDDMELRARVVAFPQVAARFLFPFGEVQHPLNKPVPHRAQGPFPSGDTDSYVNKLMEKGVPRDEAIRQYLELDVATVGALARTYKSSMMLQRKLDEECGSDFATLVENTFREEDCFHSTYHPKPPIFRHMVEFVFDALEVARPVRDRILNSLGRTHFTLAEIPIHPEVAAFFDLKFYSPKARYRRFTGESVDSDTYWKSYIDYTWNNDLLVGIARAPEPRLSAEEREALIVQLRRGIAQSEGSPDGSYALSTLLDRSGRVEEAFIAAREAVALEPTHSPFWTHLAKVLLRLSRVDEAEQAAREAIRAGPAYADARRQLRQVFSFRQRWKDAAAAAEEVIALDPRSDADWRMLGAFWMRAGELKKAEATLASALGMFPKSSTILGGLSSLRRTQNRMDEALDLAKQAVEANPFDLKECWTLAECLAILKREDEAEAALLSAIERSPKVAYTYIALGNMKARQNLLPEAEKWLRKAAELEPGHADAVATILVKQERFQEAEGVLLNEKGFSQNSGLILALAKIRLAAGDVEGAIEWATKAASAPFYDLAAVRFASDTLAAIPKLDRAIRVLRDYLDANRNVADASTLLARLYRQAGQHPLAADCYLRAMAVRPKDGRLRQEAIGYLPQAGRMAVALELARDQVEAAPEDVEARIILGRLLLNAGDRKAARVEFEIVIRMAPDDPRLAGLLKLTEPFF